MTSIAYNVYDFRGYTQPSGEDRPIPAGMDRHEWAVKIAEQVRRWDPDILTLAEVHDETCAKLVAETLGYNYVYFPGHLNVPGALVTRFDIKSSENLPGGSVPEGMFVGHWGRVELRDTGGETLIVHSLHASARSGPFVILEEVKQVLERASGDIATGASVIAQGDFNHKPGGPHSRAWADAGMTDLYLASGGDPKRGRTLCRPHPVARLDYILAAGPILDRFGSFEIPPDRILRTDPDNPLRPALSDHLPVIARFATSRIET